jgi:hypothetical protein
MQELGEVPLTVVFLTMDDKGGGYLLLPLPQLRAVSHQFIHLLITPDGAQFRI